MIQWRYRQTERRIRDMIVDVVAGARPNFVKIAALFAVAGDFPALELRFIHTGQHYDNAMSDVFLQELRLPKPICHLGVGSGSHACQTAKIMEGYENWVQADRPDVCLVVGDVNSTLACSLVAAKECVPVAHVEAGLRSFDRSMPEEVNRVLTDCVSDLMLASEPSGVENLAREGRPPSQIHLVGNVMIDTLLRMKAKAEELDIYREFGLEPERYVYLTLHRPSNVDCEETLADIAAQIMWLSKRMAVAFMVHPRTRKRLEATGWHKRFEQTTNLRLLEPLSYLQSLSLMLHSRLVVTDSGGLQEESTVLRIPCLTLRESTERPITVEQGTNTVVGRHWGMFRECVERVDKGDYLGAPNEIAYWDGNAGSRIMKLLEGTNLIAHSGRTTPVSTGARSGQLHCSGGGR